MQINRVFTKDGVSPSAGFTFTPVQITPTHTVMVPTSWSTEAQRILCDKYIRKGGVPSATVAVDEPGIPVAFQRHVPSPDATFGGESDVRQVVHRLAGYWAYYGIKYGYITTDAATAFYEEMSYQLLAQIAAPNSPQYFNTGLNWAYGISGEGDGYFRAEFATGQVVPSEDLYTHSAVFACHILSVEDSLVGRGGITDWIAMEARVFKTGSGSGINVSTLRGEDEPLSGGGTSSGMMSFLDVSDRAAGAIKSGGTTRRAAKMITLDLDHPDIEAFIDWKPKEEEVAMLVAGSVALEKHFNVILAAANNNAIPKEARFDVATNPGLRSAIQAATTAAIPPGMIERAVDLARQDVREVKIDTYSTNWDSEAYRTVSGQNANLSVRPPNRFMQHIGTGATWDLIRRTDRKVSKTLDADELWTKIAYNAWRCADPGVQFPDHYNEWHTIPNEGPINGTNPCSEYASIDNSSCNLASLRLTAFLNDDGTFDTQRFAQSVDLWTLVLEISVASGHLPAERLAENTWKIRNLGLGYTDLGAVIMRLALPYDSEEAQNLAAAISALMTGRAYDMSAVIAEKMGPFAAFERNRNEMLRVIRNHARAAGVADLGDYEGLTIAPVTYSPTLQTQAIWAEARAIWGSALSRGERSGYRNSQVVVIAPAGTIGIVMDSDSTGIEPDFALVKTKKLAGGGYMRFVNGSVTPALKRLGYATEQIAEIVKYISGHGSFDGAPHINRETLRSKGLSDATITRIEQQLTGAFRLDDAFTPPAFSTEDATAIGYDNKSRLLSFLGFSKAQIDDAQDYLMGRGSVERAPFIKDEHLAVFDCASAIGRSSRSIRPLAHVDMMAAVQPFVSGSISKTVNMPTNATIDDIKTVYTHAWKKMVKAVAVYRDGSKLSQPLMSGALAVADGVSDSGSPEAPIAIAERIVYRYIAQQRKLPDKRSGATQKLVIGGQKFYLRTGDYPDGSLGEVFIDGHREGATMRALFNAVAMLISIALQYGVPLEELVDQFTFTRYEPSGPVVGDNHVKLCTSPLDAIFRVLAVNYLGRLDLAHIKENVEPPAAPAVPIVSEAEGDGRYGVPYKREPQTHATGNGSNNGHAIVSAAAAVTSSVAPVSSPIAPPRLTAAEAQQQGFTGNACMTCSSVRVVRRGTCEYCLDCSNSNGACS